MGLVTVNGKKCLELLGLYVIDNLYVSDCDYGFNMFDVERIPALLDIVDDFMSVHADYDVYHVQVQDGGMYGTIVSLLYIPDSGLDDEFIEICRNGTPLAYCYNLDFPQCSEAGLIHVELVFGCLHRIDLPPYKSLV